jgi:hypothetical protein
MSVSKYSSGRSRSARDPNVIKLNKTGSIMISGRVTILDGRLTGRSFMRRVTFEENSMTQKRDEDVFQSSQTLESISFPKSVLVISGFINCKVLDEVLFAPSSRLQIIDGFMNCPSLTRVDIPGSVARITGNAFSECIALREVRFATDSHLKKSKDFTTAAHFVGSHFRRRWRASGRSHSMPVHLLAQ